MEPARLYPLLWSQRWAGNKRAGGDLLLLSLRIEAITYGGTDGAATTEKLGGGGEGRTKEEKTIPVSTRRLSG